MFTVVGDMYYDVSLKPPEYSPGAWLEGVEIDDTAPRYLLTSQRLRGALGDVDFSILRVKIGDMGRGNVAFRLYHHSRLYCRQVLTLYKAMWNVKCDKWLVTLTALRVPELIHRDLWDSSIDVWALGCLVTSPWCLKLRLSHLLIISDRFSN